MIVITSRTLAQVGLDLDAAIALLNPDGVEDVVHVKQVLDAPPSPSPASLDPTPQAASPGLSLRAIAPAVPQQPQASQVPAADRASAARVNAEPGVFPDWSGNAAPSTATLSQFAQPIGHGVPAARHTSLGELQAVAERHHLTLTAHGLDGYVLRSEAFGLQRAFPTLDDVAAVLRSGRFDD